MSDFIPYSVYESGSIPRLRTAVDKLSLDAGEYALIQNARTDTKALIARVSDLALNASAPTGSTGVCRGAIGCFMNGTAYAVSAWVMTAGGVGLFTQNLTSGAYTEVTSAGDASNATTWGGDGDGKNRFSTSSASVQFCVVTTPRRVYAATTFQGHDVLVCTNGEDVPIIYDPSKADSAERVMWHHPINVPTGADTFRTLWTFSAYWAVCGTSKTYASAAGPPRINQTNFSLADTGSVYTGSNAVMILTLGTAANSGDVATVQFATSAEFKGKYLNVIFEGSSADIQYILKDSSMEIAKESGAYNAGHSWKVVYDGDNADINLSQLPPLISMGGSGSTARWLMQFSLQNIPTEADRVAYHLRFVRQNGTDANPARTIKILAIGSTGKGGGFPYGTEWTAVYADKYAHSESVPFVQGGADMDYLSNCGGPRNNDANLDSPITLPADTRVFYDARLKVKNTAFNAGADFSGGLQGEASHIDLYFRDPATESTPYLFSSYGMWIPETAGADHYWKNYAGSTSVLTLRSEQLQIVSTQPYGFGFGDFDNLDYKTRDPGLPAPSDFNECIPRTAVVFAANGRLFAGNNKYGSEYAKGELRLSDYGFFGRMRSVPDVSDEASGNRIVIEGETIKRGIMCAAAADGASMVFVFTDQGFYALGASGGSAFTGSDFSGTTLSRRFRISADGTHEPLSIAENNGYLVWVNNQGHIVGSGGGVPELLSYGKVTNSLGTTGDLIAAIPSARRGYAVGLIARNRYYLFLTPSAGTTNSTCLIFNFGTRDFESLDTLTSCEKAIRVYDSSKTGGGQRIIVYGTNGQSYAYEEGSSTVALRITTGNVSARNVLGKLWRRGSGFHWKEIELACDRSSGESLTVDFYRNLFTSYYRATLSLDAQADQEWIAEDAFTNTTPEAGWGGYFDIQSTITGGKKVYWLTGYAMLTPGDMRAPG
jgi:hypothetical protein